MQAAIDPTKGCSESTTEEKVQEQKKLVEQLRCEWKQMWDERLNDQVRAEDISGKSYEQLRVERGTIIHASRDFKPLNFKEILEQHKVESPNNYIQPNVNVGGWTKFVKTEITPKSKQTNLRQTESTPEKKVNQHPKKGGRGWLHKK